MYTSFDDEIDGPYTETENKWLTTIVFVGAFIVVIAFVCILSLLQQS